MRYLEDTPANLVAPADSLWTRYALEQRAARGLAAGDSLDRRDGVILPRAQAVTVAYASPIRSEDGQIAALPLDDEPLATRAGVSLASAKEAAALDPRLRDRVSSARTVAAGAEATVRMASSEPRQR